MEQVCDLSVIFTPPPEGSRPDVIASIEVRCEALQLAHAGGLLIDPVTREERRDLLWYLEEYWKWPYEQFLERGKHVEALLRDLGERLFEAAFGSSDARDIVQAWKTHPGTRYQISIVSALPNVLSLPWELLHDEQDFLAVGDNSSGNSPALIVRRLSQHELSEVSASFEPPLRILLVTARPEDLGFVDPRNIARELVEEMGQQIEAGDIEVEFLRPPTLENLRTRLNNRSRPVHVLHFDGHGVFDEEQAQQGVLAFENEAGRLHRVKASEVRRVLHRSGVRLAVLTACQSAVSGPDDALSSVAAHLLQGEGAVDAVVAMSASVLVSTAARYVKAFYRSLAAGLSVQVSHARAQLGLYHDPFRHPHRRRLDEERTPVSLQDWWVPHFYQQRFLSLAPRLALGQPQRKESSRPSPIPPFSTDISAAPRYGFSGRAGELLQIERALLRQRLVVLHGFGGVGKTALASEAANWFIQTKMYDSACFVSFEHGGDATKLLRQLGVELKINDSHYDPNDIVAALERLEQVLAQRHLLVIADNMESILPRGDFPLSVEARTELFDVLLELKKMGAGILLTARGTAFDDPRLAPSGGQVTRITLGGLHPDDAYELASHILEKLSIDRALAPYAELRDLLTQLGQHPLAIHLVLPALREHSLATIKSEFATLFSQFVDDDVVAGRNRSLLASLEYSLRQLSQEQQALLLRLSPFEGGASETSLLTITQIPEAQWQRLRNVLVEAALLTAEQVHKGNPIPFLRFHPVLVPFLRSQRGSDDPLLQERYAQHYYLQGYTWYHEDNHNPEPVRPLVQRELPNLRRALAILMESGKMEEATGMAEGISKFLTIFGLERERDALWKQVAEAEGPMVLDGQLTLREWRRESGLGDSELSNGDVDAATARFTSLLARVEALPEGDPLGRGSFEHSLTLERLAHCLRASGQPTAAEERLRETLAILDRLLEQAPQDLLFIRPRYVAQADLGEVLMSRGSYAEAREVFEESWQGGAQYNDHRHQAVVLSKVGTLMLLQEQYAEALVPFEESRRIFHSLGESLTEARLLHQLGFVAEKLEQWTQAEHLYRQALAMNDLLGDIATTAMTCSQLAVVARKMGRLAEAEGWDKQALMRIEQVHPGGLEHGRYLLNFAALLCHEIQEGYASKERLVEARNCAEQALAIFSPLEVSPETWKIQQLLAWVAELEGRTELARGYHRRAREVYAAFEGNRSQIDLQYGPFIAGVAHAAQGDLQARRAIEEVLDDLEENGWVIADAVERIWSGERDWHSLTEELDENSALLVLRILEVLPHVPKARSHSADQLFASFQERVAAMEAVQARRNEEWAEKGLPAQTTEEGIPVQEFEPLLRAIADVASGSGVRRGDIEDALTELEMQGYQIRDAVLRMWWQGERDAAALTSDLNERESALVHRVLEMIEGEKPVQSNSSNFVFADTLHGHSGPVRSVAFTPDGQFLASGGEGELKLWNPYTGQLIRTFMDEFLDRVDSIAISSASPVLAHVDKIDGTIKLWNIYTGKLIRELPVFDKQQPSLTCTLALSPDGRILAGRNDEAIKLWELASGRLIHQAPRDHNGTVYSIIFSPDGKMLASGLKDGIELWYLPPRDFAFTLKSDQASFSYGIPSMSFSPDGQLLVTGNFADTFYLWSLSTRKLFRTMTGHATWVRAVAISPDGQLLASASGDGVIKLWHLRTGQLLATLKEHNDGIFCLAFSPEGRLLASSCQDGTINIWKRN